MVCQFALKGTLLLNKSSQKYNVPISFPGVEKNVGTPILHYYPYLAIVEHSICQPGRPLPQGESHIGSPGLDAFHRAKSLALLFSASAVITINTCAMIL